jgi:multiple sugar transport system ATP-binding protein
MATILLDSVSKMFPGGVRAVDDITLTIEDGEFIVLVGPSGCGKTTLLRMIAGLEPITGGRILIGGRDVTNAAPRHRDIAMVFQNYALYPHMTVKENLAYGLKVRRTPKRDLERRVKEVAKLLGLEELLKRRPSKLSGGQRQRVAMGRAIVREPAAFLMDEPLSNLDAKLRVTMRGELARLHERLGVTAVYVTHDQVEAMTLGQRVAVMSEGRIQQLDRPQALYAQPANLFVAAFIGSPSMNLVEATINAGSVEFADFRMPLERDIGNLRGGRVIVGIRPEHFEASSFADPRLPQIEVEPAVVEELGSEAHIIFPIDSPRVETEETKQASEGEDDALIADDQRALLTARVDARTEARRGERLILSVDPGRFLFFDPQTGKRLPTIHSVTNVGAVASAPT